MKLRQVMEFLWYFNKKCSYKNGVGKLNILITNDDGIFAEGINILSETLSAKHNVFVVAPHTNRSAVSHHINMTDSLDIQKIKDNYYSVTGFPVDCISVGLKSDLISCKIDAVVSGINCGANMGTDIIYSGTCAAARQAVLDGYPAIALSLAPANWEKARAEGLKYKTLADFALNNLETLISLSAASLDNAKAFVNVNADSLDSYKGVYLCKSLCARKYGDKVVVNSLEKDGNKFTSKFVPGFLEQNYEIETDAAQYKNGNVCISKVLCEPVCVQIVDGIEFKL